MLAQRQRGRNGGERGREAGRRCVVWFGGHWKGGVVVDMIKVQGMYLYDFKMINNF